MLKLKLLSRKPPMSTEEIPEKKRRRILNAGLVLQLQRCEVEEVTKMQRATCAFCNEVPKERRLKVTLGSGASQTGFVCCIRDGVRYLHMLRHLTDRGSRKLAGELHQPVRGFHPVEDELAEMLLNKKKVREAKKNSERQGVPDMSHLDKI